MPFLLWFQLLLKRVEQKRGHLSYSDLPLSGANYRLPEPLGCVCYMHSPQTGLRLALPRGGAAGLPRCTTPVGRVVIEVSVM